MDLDKIFHPFDIRGEYPADLNENVAAAIGQSLSGSVFIGTDTRGSSPSLAAALAGAVGGKVSFVGEVSTPMFYFCLNSGQFDNGVMITASHIGSTQNGFKIVKKNGVPLNEGELLILKAKIQSANLPISQQANSQLLKVDENLKNKFSKEYVAQISARFAGLNLRKLGKVVFDSGGTSVTGVLQQVLPRLNIEYLHLTAPRGLNPLERESRENLVKAIADNKAEIGVIFDGDGDRAIFVDKDGTLIHPTFVLGMLGKGLAKIALDMRAGLAAKTTEAIFVPSWSQNLKFAMMDDSKIEMGGETSGHVVFRDWNLIDDGLYLALKFLSIYSFDQVASLRECFYELPETNFAKKQDYPLVLEKIANYYRDEGNFVSLVDGVTVWGKDFKFNIRPSLTEPFLRLNLEGTTSSQANKIYEQISRFI